MVCCLGGLGGPGAARGLSRFRLTRRSDLVGAQEVLELVAVLGDGELLQVQPQLQPEPCTLGRAGMDAQLRDAAPCEDCLVGGRLLLLGAGQQQS